jgi:hypothetical protein
MTRRWMTWWAVTPRGLEEIWPITRHQKVIDDYIATRAQVGRFT